jgi:hypothetical protein
VKAVVGAVESGIDDRQCVVVENKANEGNDSGEDPPPLVRRTLDPNTDTISLDVRGTSTTSHTDVDPVYAEMVIALRGGSVVLIINHAGVNPSSFKEHEKKLVPNLCYLCDDKPGKPPTRARVAKCGILLQCDDCRVAVHQGP